MATAHVTLSTLLAPGMGAQIESVGAYMRERLARLPHVQEVRGFGLMNGIDLTHEAAVGSRCGGRPAWKRASS